MATEGIPATLNYRVVNRITGVEVAHDLPHLHQSTWTVRAMQLGAPGSAAIGTFRIPLHPPRSEGFRAAKAFYDQLDYGLRVEAYAGPVGAGAPRFAGIIRGITKSFGKYEIEGSSDVWVAHATKLFPGQFLGGKNERGFRSDVVVSGLITKNVVVWGEDFSAYSAANYTVVGAWTTTTDEGIPAIGVNAGVSSSIRRVGGTPTMPGLMEASGRISTASTDAANACTVGFGHSPAAGVPLRGYVIVAKYNAGTTLYDLDVKHISWTEGVNAPAVTTTYSNVFTSVSMPFKFQLALSIVANDASNAAVLYLYLNGKLVAGPVASSSWSGDCLLYYNAPATGSSQVYFNELMAATNAVATGSSCFVTGTVSVGTQTTALDQAGAGQSFLDVWTEMATLEGWYWRYTPLTYLAGASYIGTLDYGAAPGTDRSTSCRFIEGDNLVDLSVEANADLFASTVRTSGMPGNSASSPGALGGTLAWRDFTAITKYGFIEDTIPVLGVSDSTSLRLHAAKILANKTAVNAAKVATVLRDPQTADVWRELDYVTVHAPTVGVNYLRALVVGYDYTEGSATQQVWLDQFAGLDIPWQRAASSAQFLASGFTGRQ